MGELLGRTVTPPATSSEPDVSLDSGDGGVFDGSGVGVWQSSGTSSLRPAEAVIAPINRTARNCNLERYGSHSDLAQVVPAGAIA